MLAGLVFYCPAAPLLEGLSPEARREVLKHGRPRRAPEHASGPIETRPVTLAMRGEP